MDYFLEEILSQPQVLRALLDRYLNKDSQLMAVAKAIKQGGHQRLVLTGMGGSYFALYPACVYLNQHGLPTVMLEASELLHYYCDLVSNRALVVMASQSGETAEVKKLAEIIRDTAPIVSVTNDADNYLARNSAVPLYLHAGQEKGPASKTYTATATLLLLLAMYLTSNVSKAMVQKLYDAVEVIEGFLGAWRDTIDGLCEFLGRFDYLSLLGRGPSLASAMAGALVLKEGAKVRAEGMSAGLFRHGPLELVSPDFDTIIFVPPGKTRDINLRLAQDISKFGGRVVLVGRDKSVRDERIFNVRLGALDELCSPLSEIVPVQLLSWRIAAQKGLEPGKLQKAEKVTLYE